MPEIVSTLVPEIVVNEFRYVVAPGVGDNNSDTGAILSIIIVDESTPSVKFEFVPFDDGPWFAGTAKSVARVCTK